MSKKAPPTAAKHANAGMSMSKEARSRMRPRERDVYHYYDDMGSGKGNCTWGPGILAHLGPCSSDELVKPVSAAEVEAEFARRVAIAEQAVRRNVRHQVLNQAQFDALVSLAYNAGAFGSSGTYRLVDRGDFKRAAENINRMITTKVDGKRVVARGLIARRAEESAPFSATAPELAKQ